MAIGIGADGDFGARLLVTCFAATSLPWSERRGWGRTGLFLKEESVEMRSWKSPRWRLR